MGLLRYATEDEARSYDWCKRCKLGMNRIQSDGQPEGVEVYYGTVRNVSYESCNLMEIYCD